MSIGIVAKNLLLGHNCKCCKWSEFSDPEVIYCNNEEGLSSSIIELSSNVRLKASGSCERWKNRYKPFSRKWLQ